MYGRTTTTDADAKPGDVYRFTLAQGSLDSLTAESLLITPRTKADGSLVPDGQADWVVLIPWGAQVGWLLDSDVAKSVETRYSNTHRGRFFDGTGLTLGTRIFADHLDAIAGTEPEETDANAGTEFAEMHPLVDQTATLEAYKTKVRSRIIRAAGEHNLCKEGTNEVLTDLGLDPWLTTYRVRVRVTGYVSAEIDAIDEDDAKRRAEDDMIGSSYELPDDGDPFRTYSTTGRIDWFYHEFEDAEEA